MLQNASNMFFKKETKQNKTTTEKRKNLIDMWGQCIIHCATQPLLKPYVKSLVFNIFVPTR